MTTGEGGMLVSDDRAVVERIKFLRDHGRAPGDRQFQMTEFAWKYKMSAVQAAAVGTAQMERIEATVGTGRASPTPRQPPPTGCRLKPVALRA